MVFLTRATSQLQACRYPATSHIPTMRRTSLLSSLATVAVCAAMVGRAHAQACDCEGAVATLYDGSNDCDPARRVKSCTWMIPNRASMHGIENLPDGDAGWSIGTRDQMCRRAVALHGNGCLNQGGEKTVYSAGWDCQWSRATVDRPWKNTSSCFDFGGGGEECQGRVTPDVVFIREKADEAGQAFGESMVLKAFGDADVVDWDTLTVKEGKLDLFHELTATYGDGLSRSQMQAMRILAEEDAKRGVLSGAMSRFLTEDLSLTGQRKNLSLAC
ncbi:hypothetical protein BKA70DRAFT_1108464 [Coprinopsis sp. MPI-PUGE-AT-0042]|nr:hypothetical protein BKA70DRAFT_1108464 [Coprinopsis sp. MPI-PUGE-AT-0042]